MIPASVAMYAVMIQRPYACIFAVVGYDEALFYPYMTPIGTDLMRPQPYDDSVRARFGPLRTYATYEAAERARQAIRKQIDREAETLVEEIEHEILGRPRSRPPIVPGGDPWAPYTVPKEFQ